MPVKGFERARGAALAAMVAVAMGGPGSRSAAHNRESQVTWNTDVEPILKRRCVGCHVAVGFGPMSLVNYQDARSWAKAIRREVLERRMPPWPAARGFGDFINDRSLTPLEVDLLTAWVDGATPIGPAAIGAGRFDDPPPEPHHHGDQAPDLVVTLAAGRSISALTDRIELPTGLAGDRWITEWEFRPGNRSIVEQAVLWILPSTFVGAWTPPEGRVAYPSGVAQRLPAGSRLALDLRYRKSATPQTDQSGVALHFGGRPRRELQHRSLDCRTSPIDRNVEAIAVTPRASEAGASIEVVARRPDGTVEPLVVVPRYEPGYPITYRFRRGVHLRRGTTIDVRSSAPGCRADLEFAALR